MYYTSLTRGKMLIAEMTDNHLINAIRKLDRTVEYITDAETGYLKVRKGYESAEYQNLINELAKRNLTLDDIKLKYVMVDK